jgi:hypothetical protein
MSGSLLDGDGIFVQEAYKNDQSREDHHPRDQAEGNREAVVGSVTVGE